MQLPARPWASKVPSSRGCPLNIAFFPSAYHPNLGGVEELTRQLARELVRQGHHVIVLTNRWPRSLPKTEILDEIPIFRPAFRAPDAGLKSRITYLCSQSPNVNQTVDILRRHRTDVLHVQCVSSNAHYALAASRKLRLPLVVSLQGELSMDASGLYQRSPFARQTLRTALEVSQRVTACSEQTLAEAQTWFGALIGGRGSVIYNGISLADSERATPFVHTRPYIFAIGRQVPQKGFDLLLRAMAQLKDDESPPDLLLAGDGTEHEALKRLSVQLGVQDRVWFVGRVDRKRASDLFAGCQFFVLPSRHEPFGIVNLEAMAAGKAVLATRVGGVPEIVADQVNGLLVDAESPAALAAGIRKLSSDAALRDRLGAAGLSKARQFDWPTIAGQYLQLYRALGSVSKLPADSGEVPEVKRLGATTSSI